MTEDHEVAGSIPARGTLLLPVSDKMESEVIYDVSNPDLTLSEIMHMMEKYRDEHPGMDIYLDGDRKAIMVRRHYVQTKLD